MKLILAIGTNTNRHANIDKAKARLLELFPGRAVFTQAIETEPVGMGGEKFINLLSTVHTELPLDEVRRLLKATERLCGDTREKRRHNIVEMDIDILEYDGRRAHEADYDRAYIRRLLRMLCLAAVMLTAAATRAADGEPFDRLFADSTLRIDYIFAGDARRQELYVDRVSTMAGWHGRRRRLTELPVEGNGRLTVCSHATGDTLYRHAFSTLFQEWLTYPEALSERRAFENVFLVPMPRQTVDITVELSDNRRRVTTSMTHTVNPADILIRRAGQHPTPYVTLQRAADTTHCIHIAYVAEGYQKEEMDSFVAHARVATEALFAHEPFASRRDRFNIIAVMTPSVDSGTSEPANGRWRQTALGSHFDTFYSDRYLTTLQLQTLHDGLAGTPYEHIIVLVNTDKYGGGGILNSYNLAMTRHPAYRQVVVHEFGHSFGGLADEYAYENEPLPMYPHDVEPWEPNITTLVDRSGKWQGPVYEGAGYSLNGVYRGAESCRMRDNVTPDFCPVCQEALRRLIDFYSDEP